MAVKHKSIVKSNDLYFLDPRQIKIVDNWNQRKDFGDLESLSESIIAQGVKIPLRVKKDSEGDMTLIDGERRLRATMMAIENGYDIKSVPAIIENKNMSEIEAMFLQITANDGKVFDPVEEANAFNRLVQWGLTPEEIGKKLGRSNVHVRERLILVNAAPTVAKAISDKSITIGEGKEIIKSSGGSVEKQQDTLKNVTEKKAAEKAAKVAGVKQVKTPDLNRVLKVLKIELKKGTIPNDQIEIADQIQDLLENRINPSIQKAS